MRPTPYAGVLRDRRFARLLPGFAASYLGDGMSAIAISWLALQIAPPAHRPVWVALAVGAYTFPGAIGTFALARWARARSGAQLVTADAILRTFALLAVAALGLAGRLSIIPFVALLAASSVLHAWGSAGVYTMVTELLPESAHLPANALLSMLAQVGVLLGPPIAGLVIAGPGASAALAIDALTFAVLAVSCFAWGPRGRPEPPPAEETAGGGFRLVLADRRLAGLLGLTFVFFALYGPFEVGLPVYVADYRHGSAAHLAWFFTAFGAGAVVGGLLAGYLRSWPLGPTVVGVVLGVGAAFLPLGLGAPEPIAIAGYALAGLIYAPFGSLTTALFQRSAPPSSVARVLAVRGTVMILSGPVGVALGGLLITTLGVRVALLSAALAIIVLGCGATLVLVRPTKGLPQ